MENTYILAFTPGTSGRLIANFVWSIISGIDYEYNLTKYNSTHNFTPFAVSYDLVDVPKTNRLFFHKHPNIYNYLKFVSEQGVFITHIFPNFNVLREKFPNTKLILITWKEIDYLEITGNMVFKNMFENFEKGKQDPLLKMLVNHLKKIQLEDLNIDSLTIDDFKEMCEFEAKRTRHEHFNSGFMNPIIPEDFLSKTLLLEYKNICNDSDLTIKLLENFVGAPFTHNIKKLYDEYLIGRKQFLEKYMPWIEM